MFSIAGMDNILKERDIMGRVVFVWNREALGCDDSKYVCLEGNKRGTEREKSKYTPRKQEFCHLPMFKRVVGAWLTTLVTGLRGACWSPGIILVLETDWSDFWKSMQ